MYHAKRECREAGGDHVRRGRVRSVGEWRQDHAGERGRTANVAFIVGSRGVAVVNRSSAELMAARCESCLRNLRTTLGEDCMAGTRVVVPDRLITGDETLDPIGRPLRLIVPPRSSAPGAFAV